MTGELKYEEVSQDNSLQAIDCRNPADLTENAWKRFSQSAVHKNELSLDDSLWETCFGAAHIFAKALQLGRIRGIVGLFSQEESTEGTSDQYTELITEFLQRDILVVTFGMAAVAVEQLALNVADTIDLAGEGLAEFCTNLDIQPVLIMGKSDTIGRFQEFCNLIAEQIALQPDSVPFAALFFERAAADNDTISLYDIQGDYIAPADPGQTINVDHIDSHIHQKRLDIPWCDRYHCSIFS